MGLIRWVVWLVNICWLLFLVVGGMTLVVTFNSVVCSVIMPFEGCGAVCCVITCRFVGYVGYYGWC